MIHLITELSKYVMIILFAIYTWYSYVVLAVRNEERQKRMYKSADDLHVSHPSGCLYGIVCGDEGSESTDLLWRAGAVCAVFVPDLPDCL